jgi:hypothetical protein
VLIPPCFLPADRTYKWWPGLTGIACHDVVMRVATPARLAIRGGFNVGALIAPRVKVAQDRGLVCQADRR